MKVLLAGIARESKAIVARVLGTRGHQQLVADDGKSALELVEHHAPELVIAEDALADMTITTFCHRMRASPRGVDAIILVITNHDDQLVAVLDAGATDIHATTLGPAVLEMRVLVAERLVEQHAHLRDRELRFRRLFESGVAGVTIADLDGNFKEANDAFLRMLGYTHADMVAGKLDWEVISPLDRLVPDAEARAQLRATGFLPLREREYVHKDGHHISALAGSAMLEGTTECITYVTDISERKRIELALRASEEQYRTLFEHSPFAIFLYDPETLAILAVNETTIRNYGYTRDELLAMTLRDLRPTADVQKFLAHLATAGVDPGIARANGWRHQKKDGTVIDVDVTIQKFVVAGVRCALAVALDVTDRNRVELQLRQSQKMDAIGNLAGGIAHDFNNLLSVILSYGQMLTDVLKPSDPMRRDIDEIIAAGKRAAVLTRQLLAFSHQQIRQPTVLDLEAVVCDVSKMLARVLGEDVELTIVTGDDVGSVLADPGQVEQVLMNLVVNARDAMPKGGHLTVETSNVTLDAHYAATHADVVSGRYVMLGVSDTGTGIDPVTCERIFEPFFTTKEKGKGTGLGLSTVFGIMRQSGGHIAVYSEVGAGTTFNVYFPLVESDGTEPVVDTNSRPRTDHGSETILLVEDEDSVRALTRTILERHGYFVLEAHSGGDALLICEQHTAKIHVLLTDVVMPRMSGRQLAKRLRPMRPEMKVLYMSGYTDDAAVHHDVLDSDVAFIQKPITPDTLTRKLRAVIESRPSVAATLRT